MNYGKNIKISITENLKHIHKFEWRILLWQRRQTTLKKRLQKKQLQKRNSVVDVYIEILKDTLRKTENVTSNPFSVMNMGNDERERMQKIKNCLAVIDKTIEEVK